MFLLLASAYALTLEEAWTSAESESLELKLIQEQRKQSDALRTRAYAYISPQVIAGANYTINQREATLAFDFSELLDPAAVEQLANFGIEFAEPEPMVIVPKHFWDWNVSVVQPLFSGEAVPALRAVDAQVDAGREAERGARQQIRSGIASAYWGVVVARQGLEVAQRARASAEEHLRIASASVDIGVAAPQVKLQAELGLARAAREVAVAKEKVLQAEEAFARLTGLPADSVLEVPAPRPLPWSDLDSLLAHAATSRPEIRAAELSARAARGFATVAHLGWLPRVTGRFTQSYSENSFFTGEPYSWQLVFSASWTLWDGGVRVADEAEAASRARAADLAAERIREETREKLIGLWAGHQRATAARAAVEKEVALARENLRLSEAAFAAGTISYLELDDARLGLKAAELTELVERMNQDLAAVQILAMTGDL